MSNLCSNEIKSLTFFRFIVAFFVFIFHVRIHLGFKTGIVLLDRFILQGAIFMSAFFILSGFILYFVYHNVDLSIIKNRREYYIKRIAKIYPSYIVSAALAYLLMNNASYIQGIVILPMSLLCLQSLFYSTFPYLLNGGLWSLSVEAVFYCLFPFIKQLFFRINKHYKIILLISYFAALYPSVVQSYFSGTDDIYVNPIFRIPEFVFGMCISHMFLSNQKAKNSGKRVIASIFALLIIVSILSKNRFLNNTSFNNNYCYFNCVSIPLIGIFLYSLATTKNKIIIYITNNNISNYLGRISYAFFLMQFIAIGVIGKKYLFNLGLKSFIISFAINLILASLMYEFVEKKCRAKIVQKFGLISILMQLLVD